MNSNVYCRPSSATTISTSSSSFIVTRPNSTPVRTLRTHPPSSYHHDRHHHRHTPTSPPPPPPPPPPAPRRRRRLEDPIITYASNYYVTYPRQTSPSPAPALPPPRYIYQQSSGNTGIYCDLFNLLERPPSLVKQTNKSISNEITSPRRPQRRSVDFENAHAKVKYSNERKRPYQQTTYYEERKHPENNFSSTVDRYEHSQEKVKKANNIYQRHTPSKSFFRRVARTYFCMPITVANGEYSS